MNGSGRDVIVIRTTSEAQTLDVGKTVGGRIDRGAWISLEGGLGSGKTVLVRGMCMGLGVDEDIVSPSFILCEEYDGRFRVVHADFYRLDSERDIEDLGLFERRDGRTVILTEWGDRSDRVHRGADVVVRLVVTGENERRIEVSAASELVGWFEGVTS